MNTETTSFDGSAELPHWGLIRVQGADAAAFLHSQLTVDFKHLSGDQVRLGGYCSPKGRLLATFWGWCTAPDEYWLCCHRSVLASTLQRLSMFVLRAKCGLTDASLSTEVEPPRLWGLVGDAVRQHMTGVEVVPVGTHQRQPQGSLIRLADVGQTMRALWVSATPPTAPPLALAHWQALEILSAIPIIEAATVDLFVPQMVNLELLGGVDFKKGCYPGQEVVARSQYRGTVKRRMFLFQTPAHAVAGQEVFSADDPSQAAGMVVGAAPSPVAGGSTVLASVKLAALQAHYPLQLGQPSGPLLNTVAMPYEVLDIPEEA